MKALVLGLVVALGAAGCAGPAAKQAANKTPAAHKKPVIAPPEVAKNAQGEACPPGPPEFNRKIAQQAKANARDHGFLWRITRNGHSSYLYGTMHVSKPAWMFPGPKVSAALRQSDTVALELDILDPKMQEDMQHLDFKGGAQSLPAAMQARLRQQAEALCVPYASLVGLPAELQLAELSLAFASKDGLYPQFAIDGVLAALGHAAHQRVVSLETPALQLHALMLPNHRELLSYVDDSLDEMETKRGRVLFERMARAWEKSDYAEMGSFRKWCQCVRTPIERESLRRLLNGRNPRMAAKIDALHRKGARVFTAVGSLHMFGKVGLPALMKKKGYKVERIDLASDKGAH